MVKVRCEQAKLFHLKPNRILKLVSEKSSDSEYNNEKSHFLFLKKVSLLVTILVNDTVTIVYHKTENPRLRFLSIIRVTTKFSVLKSPQITKLSRSCLWLLEVQTSLKGSLSIGTKQCITCQLTDFSI